MTCDLASEKNGKFYCRGLTVPVCPETACPFYKTEEQATRDRERVNERLRSLPGEQQAYIAGKYHKGLAAW